MKTLHTSINSREDLKRKIAAFLERNPSAILDEETLLKAHSLAARFDNQSEAGLLNIEIRYRPATVAAA